MLSALVDALSTRHDTGSCDAPSRVVGWWPECGKCWIVDVDRRTLGAAAEAVVSTARVLLREGPPGT
jgi:hypothetical protein